MCLRGAVSNSGGQLSLLLACVCTSKLTVGALFSSAYMSSDSSGWTMFMYGYGIEVDGLRWFISSISTSDKALLQREKEEILHYTFSEIFNSLCEKKIQF